MTQNNLSHVQTERKVIFGYLRRYKAVELVVETGEFDQKGIEKQGGTSEGEELGELQCQKQPWLWQGPPLVSKA